MREALTELLASGLIVHKAHRGVFVRPVDLKQVNQIYTARRIIELETARLAIPNLHQAEISQLKQILTDMEISKDSKDFEALVLADERYHSAIFERADNPYLMSVIRNLWDSFPRYFIWNIEGRIAESMGEHRAMIMALQKGQHERFLALHEDHLNHGLAAICEHITRQETIMKNSVA